MRTPPLVAALTLLAGCDPCADFDRPQFTQDTGTGIGQDAVLADLEQTYDDFMAWTPSDRVCIDEIELAEVADDGSMLRHGGASWRITIDPDAPLPRGFLMRHLCEALDLREDFNAEAPGLDGTVSQRHSKFVQICTGGPPDIGWLDRVETACGSVTVSEQDQYFADVVYPRAPPARDDGAFPAVLGEERRIPIPGTGEKSAGISEVAPAGTTLALHAWSRAEATREDRIILVDPITGEQATAMEIVSEDARVELYGGPSGAVALEIEPEGSTLHVVDPITLAVTSVATELDMPINGGIVSGDWLLLEGYPGFDENLHLVDLASGVVQDIPLPEPGVGLTPMINGMTAVEGGAIMEVQFAAVDISGDSVEIGIADTIFFRYDIAADTWEELTRDLWLVQIGATTDGLVVGTLLGGPGELLGAWSPADDQLFVSDDLCLDEVGRPALIVDDRAWFLDFADGELILRPVTFGAG